MDELTLKKLRETLEKEKNLLVAELQSIANPSQKIRGDWDARFPKFEPVEGGSHADLSTEADEVEEYETRLAEERTLESRLGEVNRALTRMDEETYGKCLKCGKEIPLERLRANPAAEFDIEHTL